MVHTHSGEGDWDSYNDNIAQFILEVPFWTHRILWQLLLSGKFDKFPGLKYAVVECGSYWMGDLLWKADTNFGASGKVKKLNSRTKGLIKRLPSEYVGDQCLHRRIDDEHRGDPSPSCQRHRRPHVGHRLPAPRGLVAPHGRTARDRLPRRCRSRTPDDCSGSTPSSAMTSMSRGSRRWLRRSDRRRPTLHQDPDLRTPLDAIRKARWWFDDYGMEWKG